MRGAVMYGKGDVRLEQLPEPTIVEPTDAIVRNAASCVCGSDLWNYRGINETPKPRPFGHEYCGVVEAVGDAVTTVKPGDFVIGSFFSSDGTCPNCRNGFQTYCLNAKPMIGCQAEAVRVPWADGSLVATPEQPSADLIPSLLASSDVMGTGWFAADAARVAPGMTVAVVGDGAVGLCGVIAARQLGAERVIAMSRHTPRQQLALAFGATDIVEERGEEGVAKIKDMTDGVGADAVLECVGTADAMDQAIASARPGATVGFVGVPHGVTIDGTKLFRTQVGVNGGLAPVRRFLPHLIDLVFDGTIDPGRVFDTVMPLDDVAEAYRAMDERRAIKVLLQP
ncbi:MULTISPECIES: zinc-dependent alcohol dehydrogenase family protein [unclassified Mycolicibacterium]|uniref:zinc-dependent alcohol dehydrogenase family protein n=1 Tax=unclassified Mycolicibacterium TaxID=2636767 RepID=UPI002EDB9767